MSFLTKEEPTAVVKADPDLLDPRQEAISPRNVTPADVQEAEEAENVSFGDARRASAENASIRTDAWGAKDELIRDELKGIVVGALGDDAWDGANFSMQPGEAGELDAYRFWGDRFKQAAAQDPVKYGHLPQTLDQFTSLINKGIREVVEGNQSTINKSNSPALAGLAGDLQVGFTDEVALGSAVAGLLLAGPGGAGVGFGRAVAAEAVIGGVGEALTLPAQNDAAQRLGEDDPDAAAQIAMGAGIGAAFPIVGKGISLGYSRIRRPSTEVSEPQPTSGLGDMDQQAAETAAEDAVRTGDLSRVPDTTDAAVEGLKRRAEAAIEASEPEAVDVKVEYSMGPKRPNKPGEQITTALQATAQQVLGKGATVRITSGMGEHGSARHREGHAADVQFIDPQGNIITLDDPRARELALAASNNGITGFGAGVEYMGDSTFHMDVYPVEKYTPEMGRTWGSFGDGLGDDFVNGLKKGPDSETVGPRIPEPIKNGIFKGESGGDYDAVFGFQNRPGGKFADVKITEMTVDQAIEFSNPSGAYGQWVKGEIGRVATPMGAYQIVGTTLRAAKKAMKLKGDELMTPDMQDQIGYWIYKTQGTGAWEGYRGPIGSFTPSQGSASRSTGRAPSTEPTIKGLPDDFPEPVARDVATLTSRIKDEIGVNPKSPDTGNPINPGRKPLYTDQEIIAVEQQASIVRQDTPSAQKPLINGLANGHRMSKKQKAAGAVDGESRQIDPDGPLGQELKHRGVTAQSAPRLYRKGGVQSLDNLVASEWEEAYPGITEATGTEFGADYLDQDGFIELLVRDAGGDKSWLYKEQEAMQIDAQASAMSNPDTRVSQPEPEVSGLFINRDAMEFLAEDPAAIYPYNSVDEYIEARVRDFLTDGWPAGSFSMNEVDEIVDIVQTRGGDVTQIAEDLAARDAIDVDIPKKAQDIYDEPPFPGPDEIAPSQGQSGPSTGDLGPRAGDDSGPEVDGGTAGRGAAGADEAGRDLRDPIEGPQYATAGIDDPAELDAIAQEAIDGIKREMGFGQSKIDDQDGAPSVRASEATAAGDQTLIDGVAPITTAERLQQAQNKRLDGGTRNSDSDIGGLFDPDAPVRVDMFADLGLGDAVTLREAIEEIDADDEFLEVLNLCKEGS